MAVGAEAGEAKKQQHRHSLWHRMARGLLLHYTLMAPRSRSTERGDSL